MFYHVTPRDRVSSIMRNGLLTGQESTSSNEMFDWTVDSSFIYLWHERSAMTENYIIVVPNPVVIKVDLPPGTVVERDQDTLRMARELEEEEIAQEIEALPDEEYDLLMGSYQTRGPIPAKYLDMAFEFVEKCQYTKELVAWLESDSQEICP